MGEAELVLQNRLAIDQRLDFVGEGVEGLGQSLGKVCVGHPINRSGGDVGEGSHWSGVGASMTAELGKLGLLGEFGLVCGEKEEGREALVSYFFSDLVKFRRDPTRSQGRVFGRFRGPGVSGPTRGHCSTTTYLHSVSRTRWVEDGRSMPVLHGCDDDVLVSACFG